MSRERKLLTIHLPVPVEFAGRLGMVIDELWPEATMLVDGQDLIVFTAESGPASHD